MAIGLTVMPPSFLPVAGFSWPPTISLKMRSVSFSVSTVSNSGSLSSWLSLL